MEKQECTSTAMAFTVFRRIKYQLLFNPFFGWHSILCFLINYFHWHFFQHLNITNSGYMCWYIKGCDSHIEVNCWLLLS